MTEEAIGVMRRMDDEARTRGSVSATPLHMLLAMAKWEEGITAKILAQRLDLSALADTLDAKIPKFPGVVAEETQILYNNSLIESLTCAEVLAVANDNGVIRPEHLLLGIFRTDKEVKELVEKAFSIEQLRMAIFSVQMLDLQAVTLETSPAVAIRKAVALLRESDEISPLLAELRILLGKESSVEALRTAISQIRQSHALAENKSVAQGTVPLSVC